MRDSTLRLRRASACTLLATLGAVSTSCTFSSDGDSGFSFTVGANRWGTMQHHASEELRRSLDLGAGDLLVVEGIQGDVEVRADDSAAPELRCLLEADGRTQEEAEAALDRVTIDIRRSGNEVRVAVVPTYQEIEIDKGFTLVLAPRTEAVLTVPEGIAVQILEASGEVEVEGPVGDVVADTRYGAIALERVRGSIEAATDSGRIELRDVEGGDVVAATQFGDVELDRVAAASLEVRSSSGDISLREVRAERIEAASSFGSLSFKSVEGSLDAETAAGEIKVTDSRGDCRLHSDFGSVSLTRAEGLLEVSSDSGQVVVEAGHGGVEAQSGFGRVRVHGVLGQVTAQSDAGDVEVIALAGSLPQTGWTLSSEFGGVVLELPDDFSCDIDARTDFGSIVTELPLATQSSGGGAQAHGKLGQGGHEVRLLTASGGISIRQR